jgi:hypothetical protein
VDINNRVIARDRVIAVIGKPRCNTKENKLTAEAAEQQSRNQTFSNRGSTRRNADQYLLPLISTDSTDLNGVLTSSFAAWQEFDC